MKSIKKLKEVQEFLNDIPDINSGGCGISALAIYKWLEKNKRASEKTQFAFVYKYREDSYYENESALKNQNDTPVGPQHCCIIHKKKLKDSTGTISKESFTEIQTVDYNFLIRAINNRGSWNSCFERWEAIPKIEEALGIDLSEVHQMVG